MKTRHPASVAANEEFQLAPFMVAHVADFKGVRAAMAFSLGKSHGRETL
jgi:hypothetical protein